MTRIFFRDPNVPNERKTGIYYTKEQWEEVKNLPKKKEIEAQHEAEKKLEAIRSRDMSKSMSSQWHDTLVNLRKKKYEQRKARLEKIEKDREERMKLLSIEESKLKEAARDKAKQCILQGRDEIKTVMTALRSAEILRERNIQIAFEQQQKELEAKREKKHYQNMVATLEKQDEIDYDKWQKKMEAKKKLDEDAKKFLAQKKLDEKREQQAQREFELKEREELQNEIKRLDDCDKEKARKKKQEYVRMVIESKRTRELERQLREEAEVEEREAINIMADAKQRIGKIRKEKEANRRAEALARLDRIIQGIVKGTQTANAEEAARMKAAEEELNKRTQKREEEDREKQERLIQERIEEFKKFKFREEQKKIEESELRNWDLIQRITKVDKLHRKNGEEYMEDKRKRHEHGQELLAQMEENRKKKEAEITLTQDYMKRLKCNDMVENKEYFSFTNSLIEESIEQGRPTFPLEKAKQEFMMMKRLMDKPRNREMWDSKVPIVHEEDCHCKQFEPVTDLNQNFNGLDKETAKPPPTPLKPILPLSKANGLSHV